MSIHLTLLDAGYCLHPEHVIMRNRQWRKMRFPAMFALLEHPRIGPILFDTGYSTRFFSETRHFPYSLYAKVTPVFLNEEEAAVHQLAQRGIRPHDITYIIISHFHADHIGALCDFPQARYLYFSDAFEAVKGKRGLRAVLAAFLPGLLPNDFEARSQLVEWAQRRVLPPSYMPFTEGVDLFGDESVIAVRLPGHATGQQGIFVQTDSGQPYFLVADACWHSLAYRELRFPHPITNLLFSHPRLYRATLAKLHHFHAQSPDVPIIPSHCSEAHQRYGRRLEIGD